MEKQPFISNKLVDKPEEACGVFGIVAPRKHVAKMAFYGLSALQHRGQESAGIAVFDFNYCQCHKDMGLVHEVFNEANINNLSGNIAIAHTRYSTLGDSNIENAQPYVIETNYGPLAVAHNGNLVNAAKLRESLILNGHTFTSTSDCEIFARLITELINSDYAIEDAVTKALTACIGAYSLLIGYKDNMIAARDPNGIRPLSLGVTVGGDMVVASETCSLDIVNANFVRDIDAGEVLVIDLNKKISSYYFNSNKPKKLCLFELIYFSRPDSILYGSSVYGYRFNLGKELAKKAVPNADIVISIPDSGTVAAIGYSYASSIPYTKGLIKNRNIGRTFIQPNQEIRELGIRLKLNPIKDVIDGRRIVVVDDSIVRGTTSKNIVKLLKLMGAKEIHLRISSAPIKYPCFYGIDTDSSGQLIASDKEITEIKDYIEADSLEYLTLEGMLNACNNSNGYCTACFTGAYPIKDSNCNMVNKKIFEPVFSR